ncbi:helix-turn-helix domain-containing protein [Kocuria sp. cx-455]|uniref:helix-turn-helix domain-containing protein n=1 Tax=Kocuria sp. cx-455 TaxID=2771377 RepID=UPI001CC24CFD
MLAEVRAYHLRDLGEGAGLTQAQLAERIGVGQRQVSKIERADLDSAKVGTIRSYLEAVGVGWRSSTCWAISASRWPDRCPHDRS